MGQNYGDLGEQNSITFCAIKSGVTALVGGLFLCVDIFDRCAILHKWDI